MFGRDETFPAKTHAVTRIQSPLKLNHFTNESFLHTNTCSERKFVSFSINGTIGFEF